MDSRSGSSPSRFNLPRLLIHRPTAMSHSGTCQKCRQPLLFDTTTPANPASITDSVGALARSSYDLLSASERRPLPPTQQSPTATAIAVAGRLPAARRALYQAATQPRSAASAAYPSNTSRGPPPPNRLHVPSPYPSTPLGPGESFVVLDHVAQSLAALPPPHSTSPAPSSSHSPPTASTSAEQSTATPAALSPLTPHLSQLSHLSTFLSSRSSIDHPLCTECMDLLLGMMGRELEEGKKERERLAAWEREVQKRREGGAEGGEKVTREGLQREIAKVSLSSLFSSVPSYNLDSCASLPPFRSRLPPILGSALTPLPPSRTSTVPQSRTPRHHRPQICRIRASLTRR